MNQVISPTKQPPLPVTWVYIDGFNLYHGILCLGMLGLKWLNLDEWLKKIFPQNSIQKIKFFTAPVSGKREPDKPIRQQMYLRALKTLPNVEVIEGFFTFHPKKIYVTEDVKIHARVPEEKGTDVNIGAHLINDAHNKRFETAIVVSNDSDLAEAIRIVTKELKIKVGILNPNGRFSKVLTRVASFKQKVRLKVILKSQFPATLTDKIGPFFKPPSW